MNIKSCYEHFYTIECCMKSSKMHIPQSTLQVISTEVALLTNTFYLGFDFNLQVIV